MPLFLLVLVIVIGVGALLIFSLWGIPVVILAVVIAIGYFAFARRGDKPGIGVIERGKRIEPTGKPRQASGSAETANQRVGRP